MQHVKKHLTKEQELQKILKERDHRRLLTFAKRHPRTFYRLLAQLILDTI
jgi:hypothetical protein